MPLARQPSENEAKTIRLIARNMKMPEPVRRSARIMVKLIDGKSERATARELMVTWRTVKKTLARYEEEGIEWIALSAPRPGRPPATPATVAKVLDMLHQTPRPTFRAVAAASGVSVGFVSKVLARPPKN